MKTKYFSLFIFTFLILPTLVFGRIGVGVGVGKINLDKPLKPGMIYQLPPLPVINTGDELSDYEITIQYHTDQPQLRPDANWFSFSPSLFNLDPGQTKSVAAEIKLPVKTAPGDYFAYIEAHPRKDNSQGATNVGIAAAAKFYFTVAPANIFEAIYYRIVSFMASYNPWTWIAFYTILALAFLAMIKKFFSLKINISLNKKG